MNAAKNHAAFRDAKTAGLAFKKRRSSVLSDKVVQNRLKALFKIFHRKIFFVVQLVVRNAVAAAKVDKLQILKLQCDAQEV